MSSGLSVGEVAFNIAEEQSSYALLLLQNAAVNMLMTDRENLPNCKAPQYRYVGFTSATSKTSALLRSIEQEHMQDFTTALNFCTNLEETDQRLITPLMMAATLSSPVMLTALLERNAEVTSSRDYCVCAAAFAAIFDRVANLRLLLTHGTSVDHCNPFGLSLLYLAASVSAYRSMRYLLSRGASIDVKTFRSSLGPLHASASLQDVGGAAIIIAFGKIPDNFCMDMAIWHSDAIVGVNSHQAGLREIRFGNLLSYVYPLQSRYPLTEHLETDICNQLGFICLDIAKELVLDVCTALQELELPTLMLLEIVDELVRNSESIPMHYKWNWIVMVRHFRERFLDVRAIKE